MPLSQFLPVRVLALAAAILAMVGSAVTEARAAVAPASIPGAEIADSSTDVGQIAAPYENVVATHLDRYPYPALCAVRPQAFPGRSPCSSTAGTAKGNVFADFTIN